MVGKDEIITETMVTNGGAEVEPFIKLFGITFKIDPVAFTIPIGDGYPIYWYAIIIAAGMLLAMLYCFKRAPKFGVDTDKMYDVVIVSFIVALIGARAYYLMFDEVPISSVKDVFAVREGGLAIYGGVIGAFATGFVMCLIKKVKVLAMFDIAALGFLIGQGVGRFGNFVNQEAYGSVIVDPNISKIFGMTGSDIGELPVHPCFFYEAVSCLIGFIVLHFISRKRQFDGQIISLYMIWYGVTRFFIEGLRTDSLYIGMLRVSQVVSIVAVVVGIVLYVVLLVRKKKKAVESGEYDGFFGDYEDDETEADGEIQPDEAEETNGEKAEDKAETEESESEIEENETEEEEDK